MLRAGDIYYVCKYTIKEGKLEALKALEENMTAVTKKVLKGSVVT